jgi:type I restriction enzyme S subunit
MTVGDSKLTVGVENKSHWETVNLGELFRIKHGFAFKGEFFSESGKYILLSPGNFQEEGGLKLKGDKEKYYIGQFPTEYLLNKGELLVVLTDLKQTAPILGASGFIRENNKFLHNQRLGKIVNLDESRIDINFLFYLFNYHQVRGQIKGSATGSTVRHTSPERIYEVKVSLPPPPIQRKIAAILSAYDRLIENNTRRIEILEEMARSIYREWFVKFRSETEKVENRTLNDICEFIVDCEHKTAQTQITGYPSIRTPNIGRGRLLIDKVNRVSEETYREWTRRAIPEEGDLILAREAPVGNVAIIPKNIKVCLGQRTVLIRPDISKVKPYYLLYLILSDEIQDKLLSLSNGATVYHLNLKDIRNLELPQLHSLPSQDKINTLISNDYDLIFNLTRKIENLRQTRDLLLPRLISGEIDVENLDINTGPIAA